MATGAERGDEKLGAENDRLHIENDRLSGEVDRLTGENAGLRSTIDSFARKIASLEKRVGKNSENSSLPPSSDLFGRKKDKPEIGVLGLVLLPPDQVRGRAEWR